MRIASWSDDQPTTLHRPDRHNLHPDRERAKGAGGPQTPTPGPRDPDIVNIAPAPSRQFPPADDKPRQLGPYLMFERIARGSLSWVHIGCAAPGPNGKLVAIKVLDPAAACNPTLLANFLDEARIGLRIRHPNVVRTLDLAVDPEEGTMGLVTEYIYGEALSKLVRRSVRLRTPIPIAHAAGIVIGVLQGLQAVHEATASDGTPLGVVHRDLSPQNIVVGMDGHVRLIDFGIATSLVPRHGPNDRRLRGKPRYMAPEQIRGEAADQRADIFAAGVVLWELVTGRPLFGGDDAKLVWSKILHGQAPPPSRANPAVSPALDAVVLHALKRDRERRFGAASEFAHAIMNATPIARPDAIATWVGSIAADILERQVERGEQILAVGGHRPRRPGGTPPARRLGQVVGVVLVGVTLVIAGVRNDALPADLLRTLRARISFRASEPTRPVFPPPVQARQSTVPPAPPPPSEAPQPKGRVAAAAPAPTVTAPVTVTPPQPPPREPTDVTPPVAVTPPQPPPREPTDIAPPVAVIVPQPRPREPSPVPAPAEPKPRAREPREAVAPRAAPQARMTFESAARPAALPRAVALARLADLNRRAESAYREGDFAEASRLLRSALTVSAAGRLAGHVETARTHALFAAVLVKGYGQDEEATKEFRMALLVPRFSPSPSLLDNPRLVHVYEEAVASLQPDD